MSNAGFVVTGDGVVVFDALGTPALGRAMVAAVGKVTRAPIRRVIVSHYHADHIYGLQALKAAGAEIWAQRKAEIYLASDLASSRLAQRRAELFPWVDENTRIVAPDVWIEGDTDFRLGALTVPAHLFGRRALAGGPHDARRRGQRALRGDLLFAGRIPFVGPADSRGWLSAMGKMIAVDARGRHSGARAALDGRRARSRDDARLPSLSRDTMGRAVKDFVPFEEAYAKTDWSRFASLPAFAEATAPTRMELTCEWSRKSSTRRRTSTGHRIGLRGIRDDAMTNDPVLAVAIRAAHRASSVILDAARDLRRRPAHAKDHGSIAAEAETEAENAIIATLRAAFPRPGDRRHAVARIVSQIQAARARTENKYRWIIDPIDGTANFVHGYPCYAVSIALTHGGEVTHAVVLEPLRDEIYTADQGQGRAAERHADPHVDLRAGRGRARRYPFFPARGSAKLPAYLPVFTRCSTVRRRTPRGLRRPRSRLRRGRKARRLFRDEPERLGRRGGCADRRRGRRARRRFRRRQGLSCARTT
jgi:fructose-1,6-bisphosphatase/inositol monophosphatase family enzyme/glyoxylase-like metal-dependent hydrolase (beta-lactamase superfamily II)